MEEFINPLSIIEGEKMKTVMSIQECIDAVKAGAVAVSKDTYPNDPMYHICETPEELAEFNRLVKALDDTPRGTLSVYGALKNLEIFVGQRCLSDHLHFIYTRDDTAEFGGWVYDPNLLLNEEWDDQQEKEDYEWFAEAREYFSKDEEE